MDNNILLNFIFIFVGLIISGVIFIICNQFIYKPINSVNNVNINQYNPKFSKIKLIEGIIPLNTSEISYNIDNIRKNNYINFNKSDLNGIQFSYSFWFKPGKLTDTTLSDKVILLHGLKNKEEILKKFIDPIQKVKNNILNNIPDTTKYENITDKDSNIIYQISKDYQVILKCPLIKFGNNGNSLEIEFNTVKNIHNKIIINNQLLNNVLTGKDLWSLITFTFDDNKGLFSNNNGIKFTTYINDSQIYTEIIKNDVLKLNEGNIYIFPNIDKIKRNNENSQLFADITYFNRALKMTEIQEIFNKGVTNKSYSTPIINKNAANEYYNISTFNETAQI